MKLPTTGVDLAPILIDSSGVWPVHYALHFHTLKRHSQDSVQRYRSLIRVPRLFHMTKKMVLVHLQSTKSVHNRRRSVFCGVNFNFFK